MSSAIKRALPYLAMVAIIVGFVNFFSFFAESAALGGDALNGYSSNGRFYIGSHGSHTEVSEATWAWSRVHAISIFITHPLAFAGGAYLIFKYIFPSMMIGRVSAPATKERVLAIQQSGPLLASERTGGKVGDVGFSGPMLRVAVYPAGIVIKPLFMSEHAILASEIGAVTPKGGILGRRVDVEHTGVDSISPLVLYGQSSGSALVQAIEAVAFDAATSAQSQAMPSSTTSLRLSARLFPSLRNTGMPAGIMTTLGLFGIAVNVAMIGIGVFWAIPQLGFFGVAWTAFAVFIAGTNIRRFINQQ